MIGVDSRSLLYPIIAFARTIQRHLEKIISYLLYPVSNAVTAASTPKCRTLKPTPAAFDPLPTTEPASSSSVECSISTHRKSGRSHCCLSCAGKKLGAGGRIDYGTRTEDAARAPRDIEAVSPV